MNSTTDLGKKLRRSFGEYAGGEMIEIIQESKLFEKLIVLFSLEELEKVLNSKILKDLKNNRIVYIMSFLKQNLLYLESSEKADIDLKSWHTELKKMNLSELENIQSGLKSSFYYESEGEKIYYVPYTYFDLQLINTINEMLKN